MKRIMILLIILSLTLISCSDEEPTKNTPGHFTLSQIKSPSGGRIRSTSEVVTNFDLGDLKASREFYFLLGNGGENPITDITLSTNNPQFILSPKSISSINGVNSSTNNIIPLISLGIIHGEHLNGIGFTELLEMGENSSILTITGKTIENGVTIDLKSEFQFKVNAKKVDIILTDSGSGDEIDFLAPATAGTGYFGVGGIALLQGYLAPSNKVTIKNVGNVSIKVIGRPVYFNEAPTEIEIAPNQTGEITLVIHPIGSWGDTSSTIFSIDSNGTIADYERFQIGNDGKIYFGVNL